jgi:hypothetical protein
MTVTDPANRELSALACAPGSAPAPSPPAEPPLINPAFDRLMSMAKRAADTDPTRTVEQHFAWIAEANPELLQKAKRPASATKPKHTIDEADLDLEDVDDEDIGAPPFEGASTGGRGRSTGGPYLQSGANVRQIPRDGVIGPTERSYDPKARPLSAQRFRSRVQKFMARHPRATDAEAMRYATSPKRVRKAFLAG